MVARDHRRAMQIFQYTISIIVILSTSLGLFTACQGINVATPPPLPQPTPTLYEPQPTPVGVTIQVVGPNNIGLLGLKKHAAKWEILTGNRVEFTSLPYEYLRQKTFVNLLNPHGHYDVVLIDDPWFPALASRGGLTPLADFGHQPDPDFMPISLEVCQWPPPYPPLPPDISTAETPKLYGLPLVANVQLLWYRRDLITQPLTTVDDLMAIIEIQTNPEQGFYGYGYRGEGGNSLATDFHAWNWSHDGQTFDDKWRVTVNQPPMVEALTRFQQATSSAPDDVNSWGSSSVQQAMLDGKIATALIWPSNNSPLTTADNKARFGVQPFPPHRVSVSQLGHWVLGISANSSHKEVAYSFILWATSQEIIRELAADGMPPPRRSVLQDPTLGQSLWWLPVIEEALQQARWRPRIPEWVKVEHVLSIAIDKVLSGEQKPQQALDEAQRQIEQIMERAGYHYAH